MTNTTPTPAPISADELAALTVAEIETLVELERNQSVITHRNGNFLMGSFENRDEFPLIDFIHAKDRLFYEAIRSAVPRLLAELVALRAENAKLKKELDGLYEDAAGASV